MGHRLAGHTVVPARPGSGEAFAIFGPDDEVPEWAARQIGAHAWEDGEHPFPDEAGSQSREAGSPPPKAGPGSGTDQWAAYAAEQGVDVTEGAKREEIVQALVDAGKTVDQQ